jgi:L-aspartate oxidase
MAYRAGAILEDMEFVQFHPTSLFLQSSLPFLLSETMRGEGGLLRNRKGELFMSDYHPSAELAPRDVVARAIWSEMAKTRTRHVYLDVTHLGSTFIKKRFPTIYKTCLRNDIDITEEWIPVSPSAHYFMGGIKANIDGESTLTGLLAAGEAACNGVHGANRLASNSLLEGLVFGVRAAHAAAGVFSTISVKNKRSVLSDLKIGSRQTLDDAEKLRNSLRRLMWDQVGLVRSRDSLVRAFAKISVWEKQVQGFLQTRSDLEVRNMVEVAKCITEAALWRENSLGAHYRADFPGTKGSAWKVHSQIQFPESERYASGQYLRIV